MHVPYVILIEMDERHVIFFALGSSLLTEIRQMFQSIIKAVRTILKKSIHRKNNCNN